RRDIARSLRQLRRGRSRRCHGTARAHPVRERTGAGGQQHADGSRQGGDLSRAGYSPEPRHQQWAGADRCDAGQRRAPASGRRRGCRGRRCGGHIPVDEMNPTTRRQRPYWTALVLPLALYLLIFLVIPFINIIILSFYTHSPTRIWTPELTIANYADLLDASFMTVIARTLRMS